MKTELNLKWIAFPVLLLTLSGLASAQSTFRARLLGTAGPSLTPYQAEAGLLVVAGTELLLFDCGRGVPENLSLIGALCEQGIPFASAF